MSLPWSAYILNGFGIIYGLLLHRAALLELYRVTGIYILDAFLLSWLIGFLSAYTPMCFYLAFGFKEFADTAEGKRLTQGVHWAARAEIIFLVFYILFIFLTVRQRADNPITGQEIGQTIVWDIAFAIVAIFFGMLANFLMRRK